MTVNPSEPIVARHQRGLYKMPSSITFFWTTDAYDLGSCSSAPKISRPSSVGSARSVAPDAGDYVGCAYSDLRCTNQSKVGASPWIAGDWAVCLVGFGQRVVRDNRLDPRTLIAATAAASSLRMSPSRPRVSARSHALANGLRDGRRPASTSKAYQPARRGP